MRHYFIPITYFNLPVIIFIQQLKNNIKTFLSYIKILSFKNKTSHSDLLEHKE